MTSSVNADEREIRKFDGIAPVWWDPHGEMGSLHKVNPLRLEFVEEQLDLAGCKVLDVGCGGGILAEAMAEAGAEVTGIDLSEASLEVARAHARERELNIDYRHENLEETVRRLPDGFDVVTCMEMLEHVPRPARMVQACGRALHPGGHFFCSTINRTVKALLFAIVGGEYILRLLPRGSHTYSRLIRPVDLKRWAGENGLEFGSVASLMYNPFKGKFSLLSGVADVDYLMHFIKS